MGIAHHAERLGPPQLALAGLQVWIHGRPYADSPEPYDGDWLTATAHCGRGGASVWTHGAILTSSSVEQFVAACEGLYAGHEGTAWLGSPDNYLTVRLTPIGRTGELELQVEITPEPGEQDHTFSFRIDQSHLRAVIASCRALLERYPNQLPR